MISSWLRLPQNPSRGVVAGGLQQRWQQHLGARARIQKGDRSAVLRSLEVNHTTEQTVGMQMGPDGMPFPVHHRPSVVEAGCSPAHVPSEVSHGVLGAGRNPLEQRLQIRICQQIILTVPAPLIGELQSRSVPALKLENVIAPGLKLIRIRMPEAPQRCGKQWRGEEWRGFPHPSSASRTCTILA